MKITDEVLTDTPDLIGQIQTRQLHALMCKERDELAEYIGYDAATLAVFYPFKFYIDDV